MEREDNTIGPLRLPALLPVETATRRTICVTGATGFAGAHIVLRSLLAGHTVRGTVRPVPAPGPTARFHARRWSPRCVSPQPPLLVSEMDVLAAQAAADEARVGGDLGRCPFTCLYWWHRRCRAVVPCAALRTLHVTGWPQIPHHTPHAGHPETDVGVGVRRRVQAASVCACAVRREP